MNLKIDVVARDDIDQEEEGSTGSKKDESAPKVFRYKLGVEYLERAN